MTYKEKRKGKKSMKQECLMLYGITDENLLSKDRLVSTVELAIKGGVTCIQLRDKTHSDEELLKQALELKKVCEKYRVPLIINDRVDLAIRCHADGVHVGQEDMAVRDVRKLVGETMIVGATAKTVEQALKAKDEGADYLGVGAVFPSPTKENAIGITKEQLKAIVEAVSIPVVAIGGITRENMGELEGTGIAGVAMVSAIWGAKDVEMECREILRAEQNVIAQDIQ